MATVFEALLHKSEIMWGVKNYLKLRDVIYGWPLNVWSNFRPAWCAITSTKLQVSISPTCLRAAFTCADSKSVKRYWWLNCMFYAFGIWASCLWTNTLVKSTPRMDNDLGQCESLFHRRFHFGDVAQNFCAQKILLHGALERFWLHSCPSLTR